AATGRPRSASPSLALPYRRWLLDPSPRTRRAPRENSPSGPVRCAVLRRRRATQWRSVRQRLLGGGAVVPAGRLVDDMLLVTGMLERRPQLCRGDRLDAVLEEEAGGLRPQRGDALARGERTVV